MSTATPEGTGANSSEDPRATIESPLLDKMEHLSVQERSVSPEQSITTAETPVEPNTTTLSTPGRSSTPTRATATAIATTGSTYTAPTLAMLHHRTPEHSSRKTSPTASAVTGNSPSTSQVSVGSVGPTLVASAMRQFDLTPVTRNTSQDHSAYADANLHHDGASKIVSPDQPHHHQHLLQPPACPGVEEGSGEEFLHGEHLALPTDLNDATAANPTNTTTPAWPPLQRERSVGTLDEHALWKQEDDDRKEDVPPGPVQFGERKVATFTSREQYEEELLREQLQQQRQHHYRQYYGLEHDPTTASTARSRTSPPRTQYQPTRDDEGVGNLPPEALAQIFIARRSAEGGGESHRNHRLNAVEHEQHRTNNAGAATAATTTAMTTIAATTTAAVHPHHLQQPYPMDDRQGSIPSIHLAYHLHGSTTSHTTTDDTLEDEESLQYYEGGGGAHNYHAHVFNNSNSNNHLNHNDDWSLSSRSSSLYLPDDAVGATGTTTAIATCTNLPPQPILPLGPSHSGTIVMEELSRVMADAQQKHQRQYIKQEQQQDAAEDLMDDSSSLEAVVDGGGRKRKHDKPHCRTKENHDRHAAAMSWIESVKGDQNDLAEAASSRFLTGRILHQTAPQHPQQQPAPQQRQHQRRDNHARHRPTSSSDAPRAPLLAPRLSSSGGSNTHQRRQTLPAVFRDGPIIRPAMSEEPETQQPPVSSGTSSPTF